MKKLEAKTTLDVHYQLIKDGMFDVIPAGSTVSVGFLKKPVCACWCPVFTMKKCVSEAETFQSIAGECRAHWVEKFPAKCACSVCVKWVNDQSFSFIAKLQYTGLTRTDSNGI